MRGVCRRRARSRQNTVGNLPVDISDHPNSRRSEGFVVELRVEELRWFYGVSNGRKGGCLIWIARFRPTVRLLLFHQHLQDQSSRNPQENTIAACFANEMNKFDNSSIALLLL